MAGTIEISGLEERIKKFGEASTKNPEMRRRINEVIRQTLARVRKSLQGQARSGLAMQSDPRQAYKAVRYAVYRRIFGGQVNILQSRRASGMRLYQPPRTLTQGQVGGNRRQRSDRTTALMSYAGKDRGFVLRFLNQGTDTRTSFYGNRGSISARNWFSGASQKEMQAAAANLDKAINDIVSGILY